MGKAGAADVYCAKTRGRPSIFLFGKSEEGVGINIHCTKSQGDGSAEKSEAGAQTFADPQSSCSPCILKERFNQGQSKQSKQRVLCTQEVFLWWHSAWAYTTGSSCASWEAFRQVIEWLIGEVQDKPREVCLLEAQRYRWPAKIMRRPTVRNKTIIFLSTQSRRVLLSNSFNSFRGCIPVGCSK